MKSQPNLCLLWQNTCSSRSGFSATVVDFVLSDRSVRDRELAGDGSLKGRKLVTTRDEFLQKNKALQAVDRTEGREGRDSWSLFDFFCCSRVR